MSAGPTGANGPRLHHANLRVVDPVPSVAFYRALGLDIVGHIDLGEMYTLYLGLPGQPFLIELTVKPSDPEWDRHPGTGHIALTVDDLDAALAGLSQLHIHPAIDPFHPGGREQLRVCFLEDPTGYRVELIDGEFIPWLEPLPAALA